MLSSAVPGQSPHVPERALAAGFSNSPIGTHTGKTMMLHELRLLLAAVPGPAEFGDYQRAAVELNALGKSTAANRGNTLMYLKQLYGLRTLFYLPSTRGTFKCQVLDAWRGDLPAGGAKAGKAGKKAKHRARRPRRRPAAVK